MDKAMEAAKMQLLRGQALLICAEAGPQGVGTDVMAGILRKEGHYDTKQEAERSIAIICAYLTDEGFIKVDEVKNSVLGIKRDIAKITAKGIDVLDGTAECQGIML